MSFKFIIDLSARLRDEIGTNVVEKFNKLQQIEPNVATKSYYSYFLDSFVGGLQPNIKPIVRAFKPKGVAESVEYARLQEESIEANFNSH